MTTGNQAFANEQHGAERRTNAPASASATPNVDAPDFRLLELQRFAGNRAVTSMLAGVAQRQSGGAPAPGGGKHGGAPTAASRFNSYAELMNGFQELSAAAVNRGGAGLDTVRFAHALSPAHRSLLGQVQAVLVQAQERGEASRIKAAAAWPALAARLQTAVAEAERLHLSGSVLAAVVDDIAILGRTYVHARQGKAEPEVETPDDYADTIQAMQGLLNTFARMGEPSAGMIREEVAGRKDATVSQAVRDANTRQRDALAAVHFGSHLNRRHAAVLGTLRTALLDARSESPGSAARAVARWQAIQGELRHVLGRAPDFVNGDIGLIQQTFEATGEALSGHYAAVHGENLRTALTKERPPEQARTERAMAEAMGPTAAKALAEARVLEDFGFALNVLEHQLTPSPDHAGEWILTSGSTVIRVRGDQVESLRASAGTALKSYMASLTKVMVQAWQTYDSIKRGNSSFKLHVLGGWGGASDPGNPEHYKNSVMRVRDTIVYPLVNQGRFVEAYQMIMAQKGVVERQAGEVGDYDADLDSGYNRLGTAMKVIQAALVSIVPVAGEAALASGAGVLAVGGTAIAAGSGGAALAETGRELGSGEHLDAGKIGKAAYSGGLVGASALAPAATKGLGNVLAAGGEGTALVGAHALAAGTVGAAQSKLGGGDAIEGFAGGFVGSLGGTAAKALGPVAQRPVANALIQGGVGAGTAELTGGNPLAGAAGAMTGAFGGSAVSRPAGGGAAPPAGAGAPAAGDTLPGVGIAPRPPAPGDTLPGVGIAPRPPAAGPEPVSPGRSGGTQESIAPVPGANKPAAGRSRVAALPEYATRPPVMGRVAYIIENPEEAAALYVRLHGEGQRNTLGTSDADIEMASWQGDGGEGTAPMAWIRAGDGVVRFNFSRFPAPNLGGHTTEPFAPLEAPPGRTPQEPAGAAPAGQGVIREFARLPEHAAAPPLYGPESKVSYVITDLQEAQQTWTRLVGERQLHILEHDGDFAEQHWSHDGGVGEVPIAWVHSGDGIIRFNLAKFTNPPPDRAPQ